RGTRGAAEEAGRRTKKGRPATAAGSERRAEQTGSEAGSAKTEAEVRRAKETGRAEGQRPIREEPDLGTTGKERGEKGPRRIRLRRHEQERRDAAPAPV